MRYSIALVALLLVAVAPAASLAAETLETLAGPEAKDAVVAARSGLKRFLDAIPKDNTAGYGFADRSQLDRATLAAPYRLWTMDAQGEAILATGEWRFPVTVDGSFHALLTVARVEGQYKAVDFGAASLATELGQLEKARSVSAGARRILLRLHALHADLVAFPAANARVEDSPFEPLASARALEGAPKSAVEPKRLLPWARERLKVLPPPTP